MHTIRVFCRYREGLKPEYQTAGAAGADLRADINHPVTLNPGERALVPTGVYMSIPGGFEGQVRARSGLSVKFGVTVLNAPGTIDSDYRGEIKVPLINLGQEPFTINAGDRIAQLIIAAVEKADFILQEDLELSERGSGGFGSTGR